MHPSTRKEIGQRLRALREQAGYTREKLGELCSLSPRFIANIEFGDSTFSLDSLMTMCRVLSCTSDELLFGTERDASEWQDIPARLSRLDPKHREAVEKIIQGVIELTLEETR